MDLRLELHYPGDPEAVAAMLADPAFHERVGRGTGSLAYEAHTAPQPDGGLRTWLYRKMPPVVPDFVRRFVGDSLDVTETNEWGPPAADGSRSGTVAVDIARAPVQLRGATRLEPDGDGTRHVITATLKASVPFLGGKIEEASAGAIKMGARKQQEVAGQWLA